MAKLYTVVELKGNGNLVGLVLSTFNGKKAVDLVQEQTRLGTSNVVYRMLESTIKMPAKKADK
jgi:hypothetical protein